MNNTPFRGLGVALVTPFRENGAVDTTALTQLVERLLSQEVDFLVPLGTTSEAPTLNAAEQQQVLETVLQANNGRKPVLVGCGGNNTAAVAQRMQELGAQAGVDGFLSVTPYYNKPNQRGLLGHFGALAQATDKPLVLYNVPGRTGCNLLPETIGELVAEHNNIVAVKEASANLEQGMAVLEQELPEDFSVLSGDDPLALPGIACGYRGVISVVGNVFPLVISRLVQHARAQQFDEARRLHYTLLPVIRLLFQEGNPTGVKEALAQRGWCGPTLRNPLVPASMRLQEALRAALPPVLEVEAAL